MAPEIKEQKAYNGL
jgi:serine/threonine protein kinase